MWWFAIFLMQDAPAQTAASQADRARAAMALSIAHQRAAIQRQETAIRATPAGQHAAASFVEDRTWVGNQTGWTPPGIAACDPLPQPELSRIIGETSRKVGIDGGLVREVARQESGFRPCAVSPKGAEGLMQLMPVTQTQFAVANPFDAQESLEAGSKLLKQLLDRYHGNLTLALSAYNAGAGCVDRAGGVPNIQETKNYVLSILSHAAGFDSPDLQSFATDSIPGLPLPSLVTDQLAGVSGCQAPPPSH
jgi:soluble lytic murein transglycosylase-like protein